MTMPTDKGGGGVESIIDAAVAAAERKAGAKKGDLGVAGICRQDCFGAGARPAEIVFFVESDGLRDQHAGALSA